MQKLAEKFLTPLNIVFFLQLTVVGLVVFGLIPREATLALMGIVAFFLIFSSFEEGVMFTARSIPFFVALPITSSFDSFNMWRVVAIILFLKWLSRDHFKIVTTIVATMVVTIYPEHVERITVTIKQFSKVDFKGCFLWVWQNYRFEFFGILLFFIAFLSLAKAEDPITGLRRIIYFGNIAILYPVVKSVIINKENLKRIMLNICIPIFLLVIIGLFQLYTAYIWDYMRFVYFWAKQIQLGFYGEHWSNIVYHSNTWFAYLSNEGLRLRVFSTFPDTHSFPIFLIFGLISLLTISFNAYNKKGSWRLRIRELIYWVKKEGRAVKEILQILLIILTLLIIILSGTRGIWLSIVFPIIFFASIFIFKRKLLNKKLIVLTILTFSLFISLIGVASYIYGFHQFGVAGETPEARAFFARFTSTFNPEETSNAGRVIIWKETLKSIIRNPVLGVGIYNFPVILNLDLTTTKAGASAHNLYLHIAAEMGIFALIVFLLLLWELLKKSWQIFARSHDNFLKNFGFISILMLSWVFGYSLTDAAIFDERTMLGFVVTTAMIMASNKTCDI